MISIVPLSTDRWIASKLRTFASILSGGTGQGAWPSAARPKASRLSRTVGCGAWKAVPGVWSRCTLVMSHPVEFSGWLRSRISIQPFELSSANCPMNGAANTAQHCGGAARKAEHHRQRIAVLEIAAQLCEPRPNAGRSTEQRDRKIDHMNAGGRKRPDRIFRIRQSPVVARQIQEFVLAGIAFQRSGL